jgi:signal transduction histidine kinase
MSDRGTAIDEKTTVRADKRSLLWNSRFLWHDQLLGERLYFFSLLRFAAAASIAVGAFVAKHVAGINGLRTTDLYYCATVLAIYNVVLLIAVRRYREPEQVERDFRRLVWTGHACIVVDYLVLTYGVWLVGGSRSPFLAFFILHTTVASILLSRRAAFAHSAFAYSLLAGIVTGEWLKWIPSNRPVGAIFGDSNGDIRPTLTVLFVYGLLILTSTYLMTGIASALRAGERHLRSAREELENIADLRRAFLHVVFHDLRSPISTVATLLNSLAAGVAGPISDKQTDWIERAENQLKEILSLLRDLRLLADIDTGALDGVMESVDMLACLREVIEDHLESAQQGGLKLQAELPSTLGQIYGINRLLREAVVNYITNAIKYTPSGGIISVRARQVNNMIRIEVVDNGPGIGDSDQERLFQEFTRLRTPGEKASSRPPGSGLGLYIVRRIAEVHHGRAGVMSKFGRGSNFFLELPAAKELPAMN